MTLASASQFHVYLPCMGLVLVPSLASPTWMWSCVLTLPWPCLTSPEDSPPRARAPFVVKPPPELRLIWVFSSRLRCSFSCSLLPSLLSFFQHSHFKIGQLYILQGCELRLWPQLGTLSVIRCSVDGSMADGRWQCVLGYLLEDLLDFFIFIWLDMRILVRHSVTALWYINFAHFHAPMIMKAKIFYLCSRFHLNKILSIQYIWVPTRLSYGHQIMEIFLHFLLWFSFFNIIIICKFSLHHLSSL